MGALAVLEEAFHVVEVPERFRFSDENPLTLEPYARNKVGDLPPYIEEVITDELGLSRQDWDALVERGETYSVVGPHKEYSLARFVASVRRRNGREAPNSKVCGDCWGTLAVDDFDGSMTGRKGAVYFCGHCTGTF